MHRAPPRGRRCIYIKSGKWDNWGPDIAAEIVAESTESLAESFWVLVGLVKMTCPFIGVYVFSPLVLNFRRACCCAAVFLFGLDFWSERERKIYLLWEYAIIIFQI